MGVVMCPRCADTGLTTPNGKDLGWCVCPVGQARFDVALQIALADVEAALR